MTPLRQISRMPTLVQMSDLLAPLQDEVNTTTHLPAIVPCGVVGASLIPRRPLTSIILMKEHDSICINLIIE